MERKEDGGKGGPKRVIFAIGCGMPRLELGNAIERPAIFNVAPQFAFGGVWENQ